MKCVTKDGVIQRVTDDRAESMVKTEGWEYTNKAAWKKSRK